MKLYREVAVLMALGTFLTLGALGIYLLTKNISLTFGSFGAAFCSYGIGIYLSTVKYNAKPKL